MGGVGQTALIFDGVACRRGDRLLFKGLDLRLGAGDAALVRGANGAGKSSLLRIAAGLLAPAAGRVVRAGDLALAAEATALDEAAPLAAALAFWARLDGHDGGGRDGGGRGGDRLAAAMAAMGVAGLGAVPVGLLSTGQRKRATLARTIAAGAAIWLLDEPGNGLDPAGLAQLAAAMARHRAAGGIVVAASHQPIGLDAPEILL